MNYNLEDTMTIMENLIKVYNRITDKDMELKLEAMILAFQVHLRSFETKH